MFGKKEEQKPIVQQVDVLTIQHRHELEVERLKQDKELALKEKEFELRHFKDDEIKKLADTLATKNSEIAVLRKENEMLAKITNINADIIDVKDLVSKLIGKLPEINLSNLTINGDRKG